MYDTSLSPMIARFVIGRMDLWMVAMSMPAIERYFTAPAISTAVNFVSMPILRTCRAISSKRFSNVFRSASATRRMECADSMMLE